MIYLRARYYDSESGRFISEDPAKDGYNWYSYCGGNPVMFVDPSGLADEAQKLNRLNLMITDLVSIKAKYMKLEAEYENEKAKRADYEAQNRDYYVDDKGYKDELNKLTNKAALKRDEITDFVKNNFNNSEYCTGNLSVVVSSIMSKGIYATIEETSALLCVTDYCRQQLDNITYNRGYDLSLNKLASVFNSAPKNVLFYVFKAEKIRKYLVIIFTLINLKC